MIKHIVMWRLLTEAQGNSKSANGELMKDKLEALEDRIPGLVKAEVTGSACRAVRDDARVGDWPIPG